MSKRKPPKCKEVIRNEEEQKPFSTSNYQEAEILQVKHNIVPVAMTGNILYGEERVYTFAISEEEARNFLAPESPRSG